MFLIRKNGATSNIFRVKLRNSSTGQGLTGLTSASSGLIISTICDKEATAVAYTAAGSTIETIATLGTFAAPTATKCRFKEVDSTNHPGTYEVQLADARFAVSSAKMLTVNISGATNLLDKEVKIQLTSVDVDDAVRMGLSALPAASPDTAAGTGLMTTAGFLALIGAVKGTVESNAGNSSSSFQTDLSETQDSYYGSSAGGNVIVFTSGTNIGQVRRISSYTGLTGTVGVAQAFDAIPGAGDAFVVLGRIET